MWVAPEIKDPVLQHAPTRKSVVCFGAVNLGNGVLVRTVCKIFNVLSLLFLPPYSPQLAPIERVWKLARRLATHNRYFQTLDQVLDAVNQCCNA